MTAAPSLIATVAMSLAAAYLGGMLARLDTVVPAALEREGLRAG